MMNDSFGTHDSFGARLRRERERRHITLAQIADTTKIKASLFQGLERDDVSRWPGGIFRRSFVRAYARAIGLDPEQTCREFVERFPEPGDVPRPAEAPASDAVGGRQAAASVVSSFRSARGGAGSSAGRSSTAPDDPEDDHAPLRMTLADHGGPAALASAAADALPAPEPQSRWRAGALDLGTVLIVALTALVVLDNFWMPLAVTSVLYYFGSTLLFGATPGVLFFASPQPAGDGSLAASSTATSLDRALEMRDVLMADARPRSMSPTLHQPVDIDSRRVRA